MSGSLVEILSAARIVPVLEIEDANDAPHLARALLEGGLPVIEVTLRTSAALDAIAAIRRDVPDCTVGAGTIVDDPTLRAAHDSGAAFGVSPGMTPELLRAVGKLDWPFLPGATTMSEFMTLRSAGLTVQKLFPAMLSGGVEYLKAVKGPLPDVSFCPTGGITAETAPSFLALDNVVAVGGSWIAPRNLVRSGDWDGIKDLAASAASLGS